MNKKAFTLIELLAVIVILSVLALLTSTAITKMVKDSKEGLSDTQMKLIESAARNWGAENINKLPSVNTCSYITLKDLEKDGLISSSIIDPKTNKEIPNSLKIKISTTNSKSGNPITTYEVNPNNVNGCSKINLYVNTEEYKLLKGSVPIIQGEQFVPVIYDGDNWVIVDEDEKWYDYENQWWANAVILTQTAASTKKVGDTITVDGTNPDALAMLVWIPRYEYKIEGTYGKDGQSADLPGEIEVNFISKTTTTPTSGYRIHPAFTFGDQQLSGIWIGKFESSSDPSTGEWNTLKCTNENCTDADILRILPNKNALIGNLVSNIFYATRSMGRENNPFGIDKTNLDTHMTKNSEWGAVAYLSQSKYGKFGNKNYSEAQKEIYWNNSEDCFTGGSRGILSASEIYPDVKSPTSNPLCGYYAYDGYLFTYDRCTKTSTRNIKEGTGASTTGNIYGIYDMNGGSYEFVMGVFADSNGNLWSGNMASAYNSGFTGKIGTAGTDYTGIPFPDSKYYDVYKASTGTTIDENTACNGGICYGHAITETKGWYNDRNEFISSSFPWVMRSGINNSKSSSGIFYYSVHNGRGNESISFRITFAPIK